MSNDLEFSIIVPVFNEEECLPELISKLYEVMSGSKRSYEIIYIDDGSSDSSPKLLAEEEAKHKEVKVITFVRNFGQNAAQLAGAYEAKGKYIITIDADLQSPPSEILKIIEKADEGHDVVIGRRALRKDSIFRRIPSYFIKLIGKKVTKGKLYDFGSGLRAYSREVIDMLKQYEGNLKVAFLISYLGIDVAEVDVMHQARIQGKSKYGVLQLFRLAFDLITSFSTVPVQIVSMCGILFAILGFMVAGWVLYLRFTLGVGENDIVSMARGVTAALFVLFGVLMLSVGIIGEYIARMFIDVQKRPLYIIKKKKEKG